ncbi:hypothetical protein SUDANB13_01022 [Streptomyces sp. enrichment culture]
MRPGPAIARQALPATAGGAENTASVGSNCSGTACPVANRTSSSTPISSQKKIPAANSTVAALRWPVAATDYAEISDAATVGSR